MSKKEQATGFADASWLASATIYQVNLRALAAREPRNPVEAAAERPLEESPLRYLTRNLSRLKRLGFTVLYLLPPYPIGMLGRRASGRRIRRGTFWPSKGNTGRRARRWRWWSGRTSWG